MWLLLLNVYAPPGSQWKFYKHIFELVSSEAQGMVICGGDCNVRLHQTLDTSKPYNSGEKKPTKYMKLMIKELRLSDVWRDLNPKKK